MRETLCILSRCILLSFLLFIVFLFFVSLCFFPISQLSLLIFWSLFFQSLCTIDHLFVSCSLSVSFKPDFSSAMNCPPAEAAIKKIDACGFPSHYDLSVLSYSHFPPFPRPFWFLPILPPSCFNLPSSTSSI